MRVCVAACGLSCALTPALAFADEAAPRATDSHFGMNTVMTADGAVSYFDTAGIGLLAVIGIALFIIVRNQRRALKERGAMQGCARVKREAQPKGARLDLADERAELQAKLEALQRETEKMNERLHR